MKRSIQLACLAILGLTHPACKSWAQIGVHTVSIQAPEKVNRGEEFVFFVQAKDASGQTLHDVFFQYQIDWVGLPGSRHKARTATRESIRVKGDPGEATLHVLGYDSRGDWGEIAKHVFKLE